MNSFNKSNIFLTNQIINLLNIDQRALIYHLIVPFEDKWYCHALSNKNRLN